MDIKSIFTHWPFRSKLLLFLLIILLPALGIIVATGVSQRQHAIVKAQDHALLLVRSLVAQQEQIAIATKAMLSTLAQLPEVQNLDAPACNRDFRRVTSAIPFLRLHIGNDPGWLCLCCPHAFRAGQGESVGPEIPPGCY